MHIRWSELLARLLAEEGLPALWHQTPAHIIVWGANSSEEHIAKTLDALASQTFRNWEALVVVPSALRKVVQKILNKTKVDGTPLNERCDVVYVSYADNPIPQIAEWLMEPKRSIIGFLACGTHLSGGALGALMRALADAQMFGVVYAEAKGFAGTAIPPPFFLMRREWLRRVAIPPLEGECPSLAICLMWARLVSTTKVGVVSGDIAQWLVGDDAVPFFPALPHSSFTLSPEELERIISLACNLRLAPLLAHAYIRQYNKRCIRTLYVYPDCYHGGTETALAHRIAALKHQEVDVEKVVYRDGGGLEIFEGICRVRVIGESESGNIILKLAEEIARRDYDILHAVNALEVAIAAEVCAFKGPLFIETHWDTFEIDAGLHKFDALIAPSKYALSRVKPARLPFPRCVVRNALDARWYARTNASKFNPRDYGLPEQPTKPLILGAGRLSPEKRWDTFLQVAKILSRRKSGLLFCIVGGGESGVSVKREFLNEVRSYNLGAKFVWIPQIPHSQMRGLYEYAAASGGLLLHTSPKEVFGMVFLEAMSCGLPIVAIRGSGISEVLQSGQTAVLVQGGAKVAERLANATLKVLNDEQLRQRLIANGKRCLHRRFNANRSAKRVLRLYRKAMHERRSMQSKQPHAVFLAVRGFGAGRVAKLAEQMAISGWDVTFIQAPYISIEGQFGRLRIHSIRALAGNRWEATKLTDDERRALRCELEQVIHRTPDVLVNSSFSAVAIETIDFCRERNPDALVIYDAIDDWKLMQSEWLKYDKIRIQYSEEVEAEICDAADKITAVTEAVARHLVSIGAPPDKVHIVPNGFDEDLLYRPIMEPPKDLPIDTPVAGFTGAFFAASTDVELIFSLAQRLTEVTFVFVGWCDKRHRKHLERLPNIMFIGLRPREDVYRYIDWFDVCILPRRMGALANAMSPLKVFEYLARRKPVVATTGESIAGFPYVFQCGNVSEWERALKDAFQCEVDADKLFQFLKSHTWSQRLKDMLQGTPFELR